MASKRVKINKTVLVRGISFNDDDDDDVICDEVTDLIPNNVHERSSNRVALTCWNADKSLPYTDEASVKQTFNHERVSVHGIDTFSKEKKYMDEVLCNEDVSASSEVESSTPSRRDLSVPRQTSTDSGISRATVSGSSIKPLQISLPERNVTWSTSTSIPMTASSVFTMDFDALFENPEDISLKINPRARLHIGSSLDEGVYNMYSFDSGNSKLSDIENNPDLGQEDARISIDLDPGSTSTPNRKLAPCLSRKDSVMEQTVTQMLIKNWESSRGYMGFRRKVATEINHKYCSYCRCDEMVFVFLYVVFGMMYICAGSLGLAECRSELLLNLYLIIDGIFSVFVFPVTLLEWPKRIGGCVKEQEKMDGGLTFYVILFLRIAAAVSGTVIMLLRLNQCPCDEVMCWLVYTSLKIGVALEWLFMLVAMLLPFLLYSCCYMVAKRL
ncbi:hypothetical protein ACF0H5_013141 [Mactra antiquata]